MRTCAQCGHKGADVRSRPWFKPNRHDDGIADLCLACWCAQRSTEPQTLANQGEQTVTYTFRVMWYRRSPGVGSVKVSNRFSVLAGDLGEARDLIWEAIPTAETVTLVRTQGE